MPRLNDGLENHKASAGAYGFSATRIEDLGATEYTLVAITDDVSSSTADFKGEMEDCIKEIVKACKLSPRSDNLMIRLTQFANRVDETHGFKLLSACNPDDYAGILKVGGMTSLYDASENAISSMAKYGKSLMENDYNVNGIAIIITDGQENQSTLPLSAVVQSLKDAMKSESLESLVTILIGVNITDQSVSDSLKQFKDDAGINHYIELNNAKASTLAKLAAFVSKSISSQSQALGTGGPSKAIPSSLTI